MLEYTLVIKYCKKHFKQIIASVLCIAAFTGAVLSILLFNANYELSLTQYAEEKLGFVGVYELNADKELVEQADLQKDKIGAVYFYETVYSDKITNVKKTPYIGYADPLAIKMQGWSLQKGSLPQKSNEIAIEQKEYYALHLKSDIGEEVTIQTQKDGKILDNKYILVGILNNYGDYTTGANSDIYPFAPQIIIGAKQDNPMLINLYYNDESNGDVSFGGVMNASEINIDTKSVETINTISIILSVFFFLLIFLGANNVVRITYKEREKYIGIMRCVGLTSGQSYRILLVQGILMALCAGVIACIFGTAVYGGAVILLNNIIDSNYIFTLSWPPYVITFVLSCTSVIGTFAVQMFRLSHKAPLEYNTEKTIKNIKRRKNISKFSKLWKYISGKNNRSQMIMSGLLIAISMCVLVVGVCYGAVQPLGKYYYDMQKKEKINCDFQCAVISGNNAGDALGINTPVGSGMTKTECDILRKQENISVNFCVSTLFNNTYLLTDSSEQNPSVIEYTKQVPDLSVSNGSGLLKSTRKQMTEAGYTNDQKLYSLKVAGVEEKALEGYKPYLTNGGIDTAEFNSGKQIAVVGDAFKVGDKLTISYLVYPTTINDTVTYEVPKVHNFDVTVGAVYSKSSSNYMDASVEMGLGNDSYILMSYDAMAKVDSNLAFDVVTMTYTGDINDKEAIDAVRHAINNAADNSLNVHVYDFLNLKERWAEMERVYEIPVFLIVSIFMIVALVAFTITNSIKVKSKLKSYALLRAIGMNSRQLLKFLIRDTLKFSIGGIMVGGVALAVITANPVNQTLPYLEMVFTTVVPAFLIGSAAVIIISILSCILPVRWIMKQDVSTSIDTIKY
ncbi:MAG TPA: FtsX-like permease family protein [Clostridiales bacterium]|nr:FtsX-like permease family protein [Clostridiales bacterium]